MEVSGAERLADKSPGRANHSPNATELSHVLAEDLTGSLVADVVVERAAEVGDLKPTAGSPDRTKAGADDTFAGGAAATSRCSSGHVCSRGGSGERSECQDRDDEPSQHAPQSEIPRRRYKRTCNTRGSSLTVL